MQNKPELNLITERAQVAYKVMPLEKAMQQTLSDSLCAADKKWDCTAEELKTDYQTLLAEQKRLYDLQPQLDMFGNPLSIGNVCYYIKNRGTNYSVAIVQVYSFKPKMLIAGVKSQFFKRRKHPSFGLI